MHNFNTRKKKGVVTTPYHRVAKSQTKINQLNKKLTIETKKLEEKYFRREIENILLNGAFYDIEEYFPEIYIPSQS